MRSSRFAAAALVGAIGLSLFPATAQAAPPAAAAVVSPTTGSTAASVEVPLAVRVDDPDGGNVQVTFEGRKKGATVPAPGSDAPFTVVAIPDVQNYTYSNRQTTIVRQAQWIVDSRSTLNTAMTVQLGDLVSNFDNLTQWGHTAAGFKVLDDAAMPNTVVAGNHDFNPTTGAHTQYDQYFPPTRYSNASWTPSSARYGGYLGQNQFGTDPVDTKNMNNFALFSGGGRDWLVLNLEWEAPTYALDWARKVLAAYPDRIAIMVTHAFVGLNGQRLSRPERPGGTPAEQLWTDFVAQECQIKLVLNGHFHNGEAGESRRSDANRCGDQVPQILSDYQDRANGGSGWLRYYTFDAAAGTMTARTYSPTLNTFEQDADSQFTVPFPLARTEPAPFQTIGTTAAEAGSVATRTWSGLEPDTWYEWRAVTSDGSESTSSPIWEFRTPAGRTIVDDSFTRTVSNGWGAAPDGATWQIAGSGGSYAVDGSAGRIVAAVGSTRQVRLPAALSDAEIQTDLAVSPVATGSGTYVTVLGRLSGSSSYRTRVRFMAGGSVSLALTRSTGTEVTLSSLTIPGLTVGAGQYLRLRFELQGHAPTSLRAKLWPRTQPEPVAWTLAANDTSTAVPGTGTSGVDVYPSGSSTGPATVTFDRYTVLRLGASEPANKPPTPVISPPVVDGRTVRVDGTGSTDPDGAVTGYRWEFGDGGTADTSVASHTYADDGTFPMTLTATDEDGASASVTRQITVTAKPPSEPKIAADDFERTVANGWGAAPTGGAWTVAGASSRYAASGGSGRHILTSPGTTAESTLSAVRADDVDLRVKLAWSRTAAQGTTYATVIIRRQTDGSDYRLKVFGYSSGTVQLALARRVGTTETTLQTSTVPGLTLTAETAYRVAFRASATADTTSLSAKLWPDGRSEPAVWGITATDTAPQLQRPGSIALNSYLSGSATAPITTRFDDLVLTETE